MSTKDKMVLQLNAGKKQRSSGLELLKIIAIFCIILSHVAQELNEPSAYVAFNDFALNLGVATNSFSIWCISISRHLGGLGNRIFYLCSVWFLLDAKKTGYLKGVKMLVTVWCVSIVMLVAVLIIRWGGYIIGL